MGKHKLLSVTVAVVPERKLGRVKVAGAELLAQGAAEVGVAVEVAWGEIGAEWDGSLPIGRYRGSGSCG